MSNIPNGETPFRFVDPRLKGVGGWLALFIIGQVVLRPLATVREFSKAAELSSQISEAFPATVTILTVQKILIIHMIIFGIAVGLALWKVRTPFSVTLAKIYLVANPIISIANALLYYLSDLPTESRDEIIQTGFYYSGGVAVWCLVWFLYFVKSERVKATYLADKSA